MPPSSDHTILQTNVTKFPEDVPTTTPNDTTATQAGTSAGIASAIIFVVVFVAVIVIRKKASTQGLIFKNKMAATGVFRF